ncbi:GNAT family N-acetyltransferase [Myroides pelagicus]|uniref:GNAT family N-acetyltransferase n=1 Tax=Myroides pelagicus TaxID=270914 RepID=A0A7K1GJC1_9FLAO|nr:GNAT family N-acetyltransferase [Myroides pelagicus]MEC4113497.1 GNAT family N-acetyltransferase [Myroides pelagicus]MTH28334.1 GNAT family N-acetyltransferase [Myroides pelagicus]
MNRVYLRDFELIDAEALFEIYSDKEAMKYRNTLPFETMEQAIAYVENTAAGNNKLKSYRWVAIHKEEKAVMGTAFYKFVRDKQTVEVGVSIGRAFWSGGFGREILQLLVDTIKQELPQVKTIVAVVNKENISSVKMITRVGFKLAEDKGIKSQFEYKVK